MLPIDAAKYALSSGRLCVPVEALRSRPMSPPAARQKPPSVSPRTRRVMRVRGQTGGRPRVPPAACMLPSSPLTPRPDRNSRRSHTAGDCAEDTNALGCGCSDAKPSKGRVRRGAGKNARRRHCRSPSRHDCTNSYRIAGAPQSDNDQAPSSPSIQHIAHALEPSQASSSGISRDSSASKRDKNDQEPS